VALIKLNTNLLQIGSVHACCITMYFPKQACNFQGIKNWGIYNIDIILWAFNCETRSSFWKKYETSMKFNGTELILEISRSLSESRKYTAIAGHEYVT
jgi:hypothetical protein